VQSIVGDYGSVSPLKKPRSIWLRVVDGNTRSWWGIRCGCDGTDTTSPTSLSATMRSMMKIPMKIGSHGRVVDMVGQHRNGGHRWIMWWTMWICGWTSSVCDNYVYLWVDLCKLMINYLCNNYGLFVQ
jgi:hypothetical protein